jgi:hypothetical protein
MNGTQKYPPLATEQVALSTHLTAMADKRIDAPGTPGECAAFVRIGTTQVLGVERSWRPGPDAIGVYNLMRSRGHVLPPGTRAEVGDLLVWIEGHGIHGHIAMRVIGNRVAENSSAHVDADGDARGFRKLSDLDTNYHVIRLWKP